MKLTTLGTRGTDLVLAALRLPRRFSRAELNEAIGKSRLARGDVLPRHWKQGTSNELHRLSSDFSQYQKEGRELDLVVRVGSGQYCFRDEARPKLIEAANARSDLLVTHNTLIVPVDGDDDIDDVCVSHVTGKYAQRVLMDTMSKRRFRIWADTSSLNAYDFVFSGENRCDPPQIMECKGTKRPDGSFGLTHGELNVLSKSPSNYWFGAVYNIVITGSTASGGTVFITPPPIRDKWRFTEGFRLERIPEKPTDDCQSLLL